MSEQGEGREEGGEKGEVFEQGKGVEKRVVFEQGGGGVEKREVFEQGGGG